MSINKSLKGNKHKQHRNVLKKWERVKILKEKGEYKEEMYYGLPKERSIKIRPKKKIKEEKIEEKT